MCLGIVSPSQSPHSIVHTKDVLVDVVVDSQAQALKGQPLSVGRGRGAWRQRDETDGRTDRLFPSPANPLGMPL